MSGARFALIFPNCAPRFFPLCRVHSVLAVLAHSFGCIASHVRCKFSALMFEKIRVCPPPFATVRTQKLLVTLLFFYPLFHGHLASGFVLLALFLSLAISVMMCCMSPSSLNMRASEVLPFQQARAGIMQDDLKFKQHIEACAVGVEINKTA